MFNILYEYQDSVEDIDDQEYVSLTSRLPGKRHVISDDDDNSVNLRKVRRRRLV